jgi:hypothetical protein
MQGNMNQYMDEQDEGDEDEEEEQNEPEIVGEDMDMDDD